MRIMLITDAWEPQVNGVVRTMKRVIAECEEMGHEWDIVSPADGFKTFPLPTYSEIRLAFGGKRKIEERFLDFEPDAVHIATEGPLGWSARAMCLQHKMPFTSSYHTRFPEYINARMPIPLWAGYWYVREFHKYSGRVMVATKSMQEELTGRGFKNIAAWSRGVDTDLFHPKHRAEDGGPLAGLERPIFINVGRVAVEKNIEAFLELDLPGSKVVVGDGPQREELIEKYPGAHLPGAKFGEELAAYFANADVFVFPSLTDTFGLVILEAMAAGLPVAGFNVPGPRDLIPGSNAGAIDKNLAAACLACLDLESATARAYAEQFSWRACAEEFVNNLDPLPVPERRRFWRRFRRLRRKGREAARMEKAARQAELDKMADD
ncbi:MAG: glycosyltransferase family 1 protein [Pseudomonadota bacterium]